MNRLLFCIYDSKAEFYSDPIYFRSIGEALRSFEAVANSEHDIAQHPADFTFFHIGSFDQDDGSMDMLEAKVNLGTALDHKHAVEAPVALEA